MDKKKLQTDKLTDKLIPIYTTNVVFFLFTYLFIFFFFFFGGGGAVLLIINPLLHRY